MNAAIALMALVFEAVVGYPDWVTRAIGHPVIWMGWLIAALDRGFNRAHYGALGRRVAGALALVLLIGAVAIAAWLLARVLSALPLGPAAVAVAASTCLAQRSLQDHVNRVALALETQGIAEARSAVSHIVGRDPDRLDRSGIARAAIESLAENFSDAVVAPALWLGLGGLVGAAIYKAINTADSMIGHRTARHEAFGFAAARLDDISNLPASRLAALLIVAAAALTPGASAGNAWRAVRKDAAQHRSPNAGYPEAAMAGALGLRLGGRRVYAGITVEDAYMGEGRSELSAADIGAAVALYRRADGLLIALSAVVAAGLAMSG